MVRLESRRGAKRKSVCHVDLSVMEQSIMVRRGNGGVEEGEGAMFWSHHSCKLICGLELGASTGIRKLPCCVSSANKKQTRMQLSRDSLVEY